MEYRIFKLKSGEEIISEVKEVSKGKYLIERPMIFKTTTMVDNTGRPYDLTILKDWLLHSDIKTTEIPKSYVAVSFTPTPDTQKMYDMEKNRIDKTKSEIVETKKNKSENLLEQLFGDLFGDIQKEVEKQTEEEMKKLNSDLVLPPESEFNPEEYPPFMEDKSPDMIPMVSISMLFPPEVIIDLLDSGLLDPKELLRLVRRIEKMNGRSSKEESSKPRKKAKKKPQFPKLEKLTENEKKVDDEPEGCNWKDWPENVFDLLDGGSTGA